MKSVNLLILGFGALFTMSWAIVSAQQPSPGGFGTSGAFQAQAGGGLGGGGGYLFSTAGRPGMELGQAYQLAQQYAKSEKEAEKAELRKKLSDMLGQQFDSHVKQQQKELEDLEKQIETLRKLVKKRLEAKTTIVNRRIEQLVEEAEGLGWPGSTTPRGANPFGSGFGSFGGAKAPMDIITKPTTTNR